LNKITPLLRITYGNCSPPIRRFGFRKTAVGLRPLCGFTPPHFAVAGLATQALLRNRKTSVTCNVIRNTTLRLSENNWNNTLTKVYNLSLMEQGAF